MQSSSITNILLNESLESHSPEVGNGLRTVDMTYGRPDCVSQLTWVKAPGKVEGSIQERKRYENMIDLLECHWALSLNISQSHTAPTPGV